MNAHRFVSLLALAIALSLPATAFAGVGFDSDGDGIFFRDEMKLGTDPFKADTDEDGMEDGFEVDNGFDPLTDLPPVGCGRAFCKCLISKCSYAACPLQRRDNRGAGSCGSAARTSCCGAAHFVGRRHRPSAGSARVTSRTPSSRSNAS